MVTNKELFELYTKFNRKWFGNKLPKDMAVAFARMEGLHGVTSFFRDRPLHILLDRKLRPTRVFAAMVLLHEMVHVELRNLQGHGPKFHKRMKKLARDGAFNAYW